MKRLWAGQSAFDGSSRQQRSTKGSFARDIASVNEKTMTSSIAIPD